MGWIITNTTNADLLWSNTDGWTESDNFDTFTDEEHDELDLPIDGSWAWVEWGVTSEGNTLTEYRVHLHEDKGDTFILVFDCMADDEDHAEEQAIDAYPNAQIISINIKDNL